MSQVINFSYRFHPVGQGLFASGYLMGKDESRPDFTWVYDCGTSSSPTLVARGIERLSKEFGDHHRIDLLVLSHFDHDHISGVCELLKQFRVGTLMLPYMPLAQRLVIAFEERSGTASDLLTPFFLNPAAFLLAQEGFGIERILFVLPSGEEGPPLPPGEPNQPNDNEPNFNLRFELGKPDDGDEAAMLMDVAQESKLGTVVKFLRSGSSVTLASFWEFVPYNDDPETEIAPNFITAVQALRQNLLASENRDGRNEALKQIKKKYDKQFGDDSESRNLVSLHLYAGPIYPTWSRTWLERACWSHRHWSQHVDFLCNPLPSNGLPYGRWWCSILYTGDGYLDLPERLHRMIAYLHAERLASTGVFQVMHHGAEGNWHPGVAPAISPFFSVFSSDPDRGKWKHPHALVWRDFLNYGPVQVDKQRSFQSWGVLEPLHVQNDVICEHFPFGSHCPRCGSQMLERDTSISPEDHEVYHCVGCRECDWGDSGQ